jgi:hypothetical protein
VTSQFRWAILRRALFVAALAWLFGAIVWKMIPVPQIAAVAGLVALIAAYIYALTRWDVPKSPFSGNIAHESHPSNLALREGFLSVLFALPVLLGLAWLSYQLA